MGRRRGREDAEAQKARATDKTAAKRLGCRCDECFLREDPGPILPEGPPDASFLILREYPGTVESAQGRPIGGQEGDLLVDTLRKLNVPARDIQTGFTLLCRPMGGRLDVIQAKIRAHNAARKKQNTAINKANKNKPKEQHEPLVPLLPDPVECCTPGVRNLLRQAPSFVLAAGKLAAQAVTGATSAIRALRGGYLEGDLVVDGAGTNRLYPCGTVLPPDFEPLRKGLRVVPTLGPGEVVAKTRWTRTFQSDVSRLVRWQRGALGWKAPQIYYHPSAADLAAFLAGPGPYTYDLETDGIVALDCNVRCIGIGTADVVALIGVRSRHNNGPRGDDATFYAPAELERVKAVLRSFFTDPHKLKVGHNAGYYDRLVVRQWLGVDPNPTLDNILLHRLADSEMGHSLGYVGSIYTDAPNWKTDRLGRKLAQHAETDFQLHEYCGMDVAVTAQCLPTLWQEVEANQQTHLVAPDHKIQHICADLHTVGMWVDQGLRAAKEKEVLADVVQRQKNLRDIAGDPDFNPGSTQQLRALLFGSWGLVPSVEDEIRFTKSGDASTSDIVMRALLRLRLTEQQKAFITNLRYYRRGMKELGTYIVKMQPMSVELPDLGWDEDAQKREWEAADDPELALAMAQESERRGYGKRGIVWPDGRMRPGYNAHVTVSGRLSSSDPINAQNIPKHLRALVRPQPGHIFVGADYDQVELRIAAARWGLKKYLDAFEAGWDPHTSVTAYAVFGEAFVKAAGSPFPWMTGTKFKGDAKEMRQLSKIIQYAFQYYAGVETGTAIIQSTELEDGSLPFAHLQVPDIRQMRNAWLKGIPELPIGWKREIDFFRKHGFIADPVGGRRRFFRDGENPNEIVNTPIQMAAAALINKAMIGLHEDIPLHKWGPGTGILTQTHDALLVECPIDQADWVASRINEHMNQTHPALPGVCFSATAEPAYSWEETG